jgi:hypothetical protein
MSFDLQDVVNSPDLAESYTICRSQGGSFQAGGWSDNKVTIPAWGVVSVASDRQIGAIPEADRVGEIRSFISECPIYTTSETRGAVSDILIWNGTKYRVLSVGRYDNRGGFYSALAVRLKGA